MHLPRLAVLAGWLALVVPAAAQSAFVNWESPHVSPLALTPDGARLLAVNTADNRLEVFDATRAIPLRLADVPVGLDPVSVRARTNDEVWVVNHVSDSVSVISLSAQAVVATIATDDEPCDVVFAGSPQRAFVSCSQANTVLVFDPADLTLAPTRVPIQGEDPRAMAVSPDGARVYVAVFESGNGTTVLGGGAEMGIAFPPNVVSDPAGPWGGQNPPPNSGTQFNPPINPLLPVPPKVALIVRRDDQGRWMDDNGGDWTALVSGPQASKSGRQPGWDLLDHDLAVIDAASLTVSYAGGLANICMALAVNPASGEVSVVGTDATNEVRYEPVLQGRFLRVQLARTAAAGGAALDVVDLNPHLDYSVATVPQAARDESLGDPRGLVWNAAGTKGYVSGMGSNNVVVLDALGQRAGSAPTIEVGEGPTGVALDEATSRLFVLDKFEGAISVVDTSSELEVARVPFHDPTPAAVRAGRKHLYDTHRTSGLGHIACASCHVDARMDQLAWDLGDPSGSLKALTGSNLGANTPGLNTGFLPWHPMKGPMTTQTLQDIIGKEPLHWRGDRFGLEEFNGAFIGLQGDDADLAPAEMQQFEDMLASIHFPPNPFRELDNSLPAVLPLPGHYTTGRFAPAGQPLPDGNPQNGLTISRPPRLLDNNALACVTCHTLPTGIGTNYTLQGFSLVPIPPGPDGELHHMLVSNDGVTNRTMKVPQLRNLHEKVGFEMTQPANTSGFGFLHDGSIDSIARFVSEPVFTVTSDQEVADLVAFMLCFAGSDLPQGSTGNLLEPPGTASQDTHAAVGRQTTLVDAATASPAQLALIATFEQLADAGAVGLVAKGRLGGQQRGFAYLGGSALYASDRLGQTLSATQLAAAAQPGSELTWTVVPAGSEQRIGIDRDQDGYYDRDELDAGSDPADPDSTPAGCAQAAPAAPTGLAAIAVGPTQVNLSWADNAVNESGYAVERALAGSGGWQLVATLPAGSTAWPDAGVACDTTYDWRVSASNCAGSSGFALAQGASGSCCPAPTSYCVGAPNSAGPGAVMSTSGTTSVAAADLVLAADGAPPGNLGVFFYGGAQQQKPYGHGFLCIANGGLGVYRLLPAATIDGTGHASHAIDFGQPPAGSGPGALLAGSTWNFQFWYRDPAAGGAGFNLSDALSATFCP